MTVNEKNATVAEGQVVAGVQRLMEALSLSVSILLGLSGAAYVIGWFSARAYLSEFGALWLLPELSAATLLGHSWIPLATIAFFSYIGISDLIGSKTEEFPSTKINRYLWVFAAISIAAAFASKFRHDYQAILAGLSAIVAVVLAGATIELSVLRLGKSRRESDSSHIHLAYAVILFCIYMAPTQVGRARALQDLSAVSTELGVIKTDYQSESNLRLLMISGERAYALSIDDPARPPEVRIIPVSSIYSVRRTSKPRAPN